MTWFKKSPVFRYGCRVVVAAVAAYVVSAWHDGAGDWKAIAKGATAAAIYALVGLLSPVEPFVGVKPDGVEVPVPPAMPEQP